MQKKAIGNGARRGLGANCGPDPLRPLQLGRASNALIVLISLYASSLGLLLIGARNKCQVNARCEGAKLDGLAASSRGARANCARSLHIALARLIKAATDCDR